MRDARLRKEEALSVAAALYGEILLLRNEIAALARAVANVEVLGNMKIDKHFVEAFTLSEPLLYKALAPKIGFLSADLIVLITEFYKNLQEAKTWLPLLEKTDPGYSYTVSSVLEPACNAVNDIIPFLRHVEGVMRILKPAGELDLGHADAVLELDAMGKGPLHISGSGHPLTD